MNCPEKVVRAAGLEPASFIKARDFKSLVFTNFTTPAFFRKLSETTRSYKAQVRKKIFDLLI